MKKPSVAECLDEIRRLRAENERLTRLVKTQRPELDALRDVECWLRNHLFNLPMQLEELHSKVKVLLPGNDDLPSFDEMRGCLSKGVDHINAALEVGATAGAVDPVGELAERDPSTRV